MARIPRPLLALGGSVLLATSVVLGVWLRLLLGEGALPNVRVAGVGVPTGSSLSGFFAQQARDWGSQRITLEAGPYIVQASRAQLGAYLPSANVRRRVAELGRSGNPVADLGAWWQSRNGGFDLSWAPSIDRAKLRKFMADVRSRVERLPTPGTYDIHGELVPGIEGVTLNLLEATAAVERAIRNGQLHASAGIATTPPPPPVRYESAADAARELLTAFETKFKVGKVERSINIRRAARAIHGQVILPGAVLSFNDAVGERTLQRGFAPALELRNRRVVMGVGGGVCQVAGTLHAAAFLSGLSIDEYRHHSRRARYIPRGLDTMVAWPNKDLKIRNPYPFPVTVRSSAEADTVRVELWGAGRPYPVTWSAEQMATSPAGERTEIDPGLAPGQQKVVQRALDGFVILRTRVVMTPTGRKREEVRLNYRPHDKIIAVGA